MTAINTTIQFDVYQAYGQIYKPNHLKNTGAVNEDIIDSTLEQTLTYYTVTTKFAAGETIDLTDGSGSGSGDSTKDGVNPLLPANAADFKSNGFVSLLVNGTEFAKGIVASGDDFEWVSTTSVKTNRKLKAGGNPYVIAVRGLTAY